MRGIAPTITKGNKPFIRVILPVPSFSPVIAKLDGLIILLRTFFKAKQL